MDHLTTCPRCHHTFDFDPDDRRVWCPSCACRFRPWDEDAEPLEYEPDYGGTFDGFTVHSDADPGL